MGENFVILLSGDGQRVGAVLGKPHRVPIAPGGEGEAVVLPDAHGKIGAAQPQRFAQLGAFDGLAADLHHSCGFPERSSE